MMWRKTTLQSSLFLLGGLFIAQGCLPSLAQTAVSAAQAPPIAPAAAPSDTVATPAAAAPVVAPAAAGATAPTEIPRSEMIHRTLYAIYDKQDNRDLAAAELDELTRLRPTDPVFPFTYGELLLKDNKYPEAQARFEAAVKLDPTFSNAYCGIGDCQFKMKKYSEAVVSYTQASRNAKAGQNYQPKIAIAKQWQERKQQEDDYAAALKKISGGGTKTGVKKK